LGKKKNQGVGEVCRDQIQPKTGLSAKVPRRGKKINKVEGSRRNVQKEGKFRKASRSPGRE